MFYVEETSLKELSLVTSKLFRRLFFRMRRVKFYVLHLHRLVLISLHDLFCELFEESLGLLISTSIFEVRFSGYNSRGRVVSRYLEDV